MKQRLTVSAIFFAAVLILSVTSHLAITKKIDKVDQLLNQVFNVVCENRMPTEEYHVLKEEWDKNSLLFHIFISKTAISDLEKSIESMERIISIKDTEYLRLRCIECLKSLEEIQESVKINLKNTL